MEMNNDLKKLLLCLKWDVDNIENLNSKRDYVSGRIDDIQDLVKNHSISDVKNSILVDLIKEVYQRGYDDGYNEMYNSEYVGRDQTKLVEIKGVEQVIQDVMEKYCS